MPEIDGYSLVFPVVSGVLHPNGVDLNIKTLIGTSFYIGQGFYLTAGHVIQNALEYDITALGITKSNTPWNAIKIEAYEIHEGIDIVARKGTPIKAARAGHVIYASNQISGYGNLVIVRHTGTDATVYAHLSSFSVKRGQFVSKGALLGRVGMTGHATSPHLHFEIRTRDRRGKAVAVDPLPLLKPDDKDKPRFRINDSLQPLLAWLE